MTGIRKPPSKDHVTDDRSQGRMQTIPTSPCPHGCDTRLRRLEDRLEALELFQTRFFQYGEAAVQAAIPRPRLASVHQFPGRTA
jgi:hypothetical protein